MRIPTNHDTTQPTSASTVDPMDRERQEGNDADRVQAEGQSAPSSNNAPQDETAAASTAGGLAHRRSVDQEPSPTRPPSPSRPVVTGASVKSRMAAYMANVQSSSGPTGAGPKAPASPVRTWQKPAVAHVAGSQPNASRTQTLPTHTSKTSNTTASANASTSTTPSAPMSPLQSRLHQDSQHSSFASSKDPLLELVSIDDTNTFYEDKPDDDEEEVSYEHQSREYPDESETNTDDRDVSYDDSFVEETLAEEEDYESVEETIIEEDTELDSRMSTPPGSAYNNLLGGDQREEEEPSEESSGSSESGQDSDDSGSSESTSDSDASGDEHDKSSTSESLPKSNLDLASASADASSSHNYDPETPLVANKPRMDSVDDEETASPRVKKQSSLARLSPASLLNRSSKMGYQDLPAAPVELDTCRQNDKGRTVERTPPQPQATSAFSRREQSTVDHAGRISSLTSPAANGHRSERPQEEKSQHSGSSTKSWKRGQRLRQDKLILVPIFLIVALLITGLIGLIIWLVNGRNDSQSSALPVQAPTRYPSRKPILTQSPSQQPNVTLPTTAPVNSGDSILEFRGSLPTYTISALADTFSPQSLAFQWVTSEQQFSALPLERRNLRFALATLYYSTSGASWTNNAFWLSSTNECFWWTSSGSSCRGSQFAFLDLSDNNLNGVLPREISLMPGLSSLVLDRNPGLVGSIPDTIDALTGLQDLSLGSNSLRGSLPSTFSLLTSLTSLNLALNQLTGTLMSSWDSLTDLASLYLNGNRLTGSIPATLNSLNALQYLRLDSNRLSGSVPTSLSDLTNLAELQLHDNSLTGSLAGSFFTQLGNSNLVVLSLGENSLTGSLLPAVGRLRSVQVLDLSGNGFTGDLPTTLGRLTSMRQLDFANNSLSGTIPTELGEMTALRTLVLSGNAFTGSVPADVCGLVEPNSLFVSIDCDSVTCTCGCVCYVEA